MGAISSFGWDVFAFLHRWDCDFHIWVILLIEVVGVLSWITKIAPRLHAFPFVKLILWLC